MGGVQRIETSHVRHILSGTKMDYYIKNNICKENNQSAEVSGDDRGPPAWTLCAPAAARAAGARGGTRAVVCKQRARHGARGRGGCKMVEHLRFLPFVNCQGVNQNAFAAPHGFDLAPASFYPPVTHASALCRHTVTDTVCGIRTRDETRREYKSKKREVFAEQRNETRTCDDYGIQGLLNQMAVCWQ